LLVDNGFVTHAGKFVITDMSNTSRLCLSCTKLNSFTRKVINM